MSVAAAQTATADRRLNVARSLIDLAADPTIPTAEYLRHYLADHVRDAGPEAWDLLAAQPQVLDQLDPESVATAAVRTEFGERAMPAQIAAMVGARHELAKATAADRPGLRQIAVATFGPGEPPSVASGSRAWSVRDALLDRRHVHLVLDAGDLGIRSLATYLDLDGALRILAGTSRGITRIWDPITGVLIGELTGHEGPVRALVTRQDPSRLTVASAGEDGRVMLWDTALRTATSAVETGTPLWALDVVASDQQACLVAGGRDGRLRVWDLGLGDRPELPAMTAWVTAMAPIGDLLAVGDDAGHVRLVDVVSGEVRWDMQHAGGGVRALSVTAGEAGLRILACFSDEDAWVLGSDGAFLAELPGFQTRAATTFPAAGRSVLGIADAHDLVLVDSETLTVLTRLVGHTGDIRAAVPLPAGAGSLAVATGAKDGSVRCWRFAPQSDGSTDERSDRVDPIGPVSALLTDPASDGPRLVMGDAQGRVHVVHSGTEGLAQRQTFGVAPNRVTSLAAMPVQGQPTLMVGSRDGPPVADSMPVAVAGPYRLINQAGARHLLADQTEDTLWSGYGDGRITAWSGRTDELQTWTLGSQVVGLAPAGEGVPWQSLAADVTGRLWGVPRSADAEPVELYAQPDPITAILAIPGEGGRSGVAVAVGEWIDILNLTEKGAAESRAVVTAHRRPVLGLCLMAGASAQPRLVSGDTDGLIVVYDPIALRELVRLTIGLPVLSLAAYDDALAVGTSGGVLILDLAP
jgi:WD40 repeat protein